MRFCNPSEMRDKCVAIVGLGYVGLPMAVAFAQANFKVIGYDIDIEKIMRLRNFEDPTKEIEYKILEKIEIEYTNNDRRLGDAKYIIVTVPTPVNSDKTPDLAPVIKACISIGKNLSKGSIVIFESTVYPGVTEGICIPVLERESNMSCNRDFSVGYSPERINPGDRIHNFENIVKIVSASNSMALKDITELYSLVVKAGVYETSSIKIAEAAKVVENSQRDINIAFMNELAIVFDKMAIDTREVIDAMNTKWNALKFYPGLVGGHCIGVDPYYFIYEAEKLGYHSQIILNGRKINDSMGQYIADVTIKKLTLAGKIVRDSRIGIWGITFKENCPDIRNSRVIDVINRLKEYGISPMIYDPWAEKVLVERSYGIKLLKENDLAELDCQIFAVAHKQFYGWGPKQLDKHFREQSNSNKVIIDVKGILDRAKLLENDYSYWRL